MARSRKPQQALYPFYVKSGCEQHGLPLPVAEYRFAPPRRWRFDFAWPALQVALEVEGGLWVYGRHNRAAGFLADSEKYNTAAVMGWRVIRCEPKQLQAGQPFRYLVPLLADMIPVGPITGG